MAGLVFVLRAGVVRRAERALAAAVGARRDAPSPDEKCYLCAWHKVLQVLPISWSAQVFSSIANLFGKSGERRFQEGMQ